MIKQTAPPVLDQLNLFSRTMSRNTELAASLWNLHDHQLPYDNALSPDMPPACAPMERIVQRVAQCLSRLL